MSRESPQVRETIEMIDDPIAYLLQSRAKPGGIDPNSRWFRLSWLLPLLALLVPCNTLSDAEALLYCLCFLSLVGCGVGLFFVLVGTAFKQLAHNISLHNSLLKSQSYPDLLMSGVEPQAIVDGITKRCFSSFLTSVSWQALLAYALGCAVFAVRADKGLPAGLTEQLACGLFPFLALGLFMLALLAFTLWASYLGQWSQLAVHLNSRRTNLQLVLVGVALVATLAWAGDGALQFGLFVPSFYLLTLMASRRQSICIIQSLHLNSEKRRASARVNPPNRWLLTQSDNPIAFRQSVHFAATVGGGLGRAMLVRFPLVLFFGVLIASGSLGTWGALEVFAFLATIQMIRAANSASSAMSAEFQQHTLEPLTCTPTSSEQVWRGWANFVLRPLIVETFILSGMLVAEMLTAGSAASAVSLAAVVVSLMLLWLGFCLGFYCSCQPTLSASKSRLFEHLLAVMIMVPAGSFYLGVIIGAPIALKFEGLVPLAGLVVSGLLLLSLGWLSEFYRRRALRWLNTDHSQDVGYYHSSKEAA